MATTLTNTNTVVAENGMIPLPDQLRRQLGLLPGDELSVVWSPPDTLMVRKVSEVAKDDHSFRAEMRAFRQALQAAGYQSRADIIKLVREVKAEQAAEWREE